MIARAANAAREPSMEARVRWTTCKSNKNTFHISQEQVGSHIIRISLKCDTEKQLHLGIITLSDILTHANTPTQNAYHSANTHTDIQSAYLDTLAHANAHTKCISRYV